MTGETEAEKNFRLFFDYIPDGALLAEVKTKKIGFANQAICRMLGVSQAEIKRMSLTDIHPRENLAYLSEQFDKMARGKLSSIKNIPVRRKNKSIFYADIAASPPVTFGGKKYFMEVFRDITHEKELDQAENDFLSLASHQLRTPLSASKWILEMMLQSGGLSDKQKEYLGDLVASNDRLISLVNGLLDATRIEAGEMAVNKKQTDLVELILVATRLARPNLEKKKQKINLLVTAKVKPAIIDPMLFSESLNNILNNACNFAPKNGNIDILVKADRKNYIIGVRNFGPLIPKTEQDKVFSKFYRGHNAKNYQYVGSGLGLFIAKAAVEANGGRIWFESTPKRGTTFYLTIPK